MDCEEVWKDVIGYDGAYQVSNLGNVKSVDRTIKHPTSKNGKALRKGKILGQHLDSRGYHMVYFCKDGKMKAAKVYREVAKAFISNPEHKREVNHKDGNKSNNCVSNLEWSTPKENSLHSFNIGLRENCHSDKHPKAKLTNEQVRDIRARYSVKPKCVTRPSLAEEYSVSLSVVNKILSGRTWKRVS